MRPDLNKIIRQRNIDQFNKTLIEDDVESRRTISSLPSQPFNERADVNLESYTDYLGENINLRRDDVDEMRAQAQGWWERTGRGLGRAGTELTLGSIKGISDIPDVIRALASEDGLGSLANIEFANEVSYQLGQMQDDVRDAMPIYREKSSEGFSPLHWSWYMDNIESIASGLSMMLPIMGAAKGIGAITKGANWLGKAAKVGKINTQADAALQTIGGALYGNLYETFQELGDVLPSLKQQMQDSGMTQEEMNTNLSNIAHDMYMTNLPNAALDAIGIHNIIKPGALTRGVKLNPKSIKNSLIQEVLPEGLQEGVNFYATEKAKRDTDILTGVRGDNYSMSELVNDPEAWTAMFFGSLGGAAFQGGGNTFRQVSENIDYNADIEKNLAHASKVNEKIDKIRKESKRGLLSGVGGAMFSGMTINERKDYSENVVELTKLQNTVTKLNNMKSMADIAGDTDLVNAINKNLETETALLSMQNRRFDSQLKMLDYIDKMLAQFNGTQEATEDTKKLHGRVVEAKEKFKRLEKSYKKGVGFYELQRGPVVNQYVRLSERAKEIDDAINGISAYRDGILKEDEHGIIRNNANAISKLRDQIEGVEQNIRSLKEQYNQREYIALNEDGSLNKEGNKILSDIKKEKKKLDNLSKELNKIKPASLLEDVEVQAAKLSIEKVDVNNKIENVLNGNYKKQLEKISNLRVKDAKYANWLYGSLSKPGSGFIDTVDKMVNESKIQDIIDGSSNMAIQNRLDLKEEPISDILEDALKINSNKNTKDKIQGSMKEALSNNALEAREKLEKHLQDNNITIYDSYGDETTLEDVLGSVEIDGEGKMYYNNQEFQFVKDGVEDNSSENIINDLIRTNNGIIEKSNAVLAKKEILDYTIKDKNEVAAELINKNIDSIMSDLSSIIEQIEMGEGMIPDDIISNHSSYLKMIDKYLNDKEHNDGITKKDLPKLDDAISLSKEAKTKADEFFKNQDKDQEAKYSKWVNDKKKSIQTYLPNFNSDSLKDIDEKIKELSEDKNILSKIDKEILDIFNSVPALRESAWTLENVKENPEQVFYYLLAIARNINNDEDTRKRYKHVLDPYLSFKKDGTWNIPDSYVASFDALEKIHNYVNLKRELTSSLDYKNLSNAWTIWMKKQTNTSAIPFKEQIVAINTFLKMYNEKDSNGTYTFDKAFLQGLAGTGKSSIAARVIMELLDITNGVKRDEVVAIAKGRYANENINSVMFRERNSEEHNKEIFKDNKINEDIRQALFDKMVNSNFMVVDEIGKVDQLEYQSLLQLIQEVREKQKGTKKYLSVLMTGDLTQQGATINSFMNTSDIKSRVLPSLTIQQRTSNGDVLSFQNEFLKNSNDNTFLNTTFTQSHNSNMTNGVMSSTIEADFIDMLKQKDLLAKENNKTPEGSPKRAILVDTQEKKDKYSKVAPHIPVFVNNESQGLEFDETYIDFDYNKTVITNNYDKANNNIYTAISRTRLFTYMYSPMIKHENNESFESDVDTNNVKNKKLKENREEFKKWLTSLQNIFDIKQSTKKEKEKDNTIKDETVVDDATTKDTSKQDVQEDIVDINEENNDDNAIENVSDSIDLLPLDELENGEVDTYKILIKDETDINNEDTIVYSNYDGIKAIEDNDLLDENIYVFVRENKDNKKKFHYVYLAKTLINNNPTFVELAIRPIPDNTDISFTIEYAKQYSENAINIANAAYTTSINKASTIKFHYTNEKYSLNKDGIEQIHKGLKELFNRNNWTDISVTGSLFIASKNNTKSLIGYVKQLLKPGKSFYKANIKYKDNNGIARSKDYYIALDEAKYRINKSDGTKSYLGDLNDTVGKIRQLEDVFNALGYNYAYGIGTQTEEQYGQRTFPTSNMRMFIEALAFDINNGYIVPKSMFNKTKELYKNIENSPNKNDILKLIKEVRDGIYKMNNESIADVVNINQEWLNTLTVYSDSKYTSILPSTTKGIDMLGEDVAKLATDNNLYLVETNWNENPAYLRSTMEYETKDSSGEIHIYQVKIDYALKPVNGKYEVVNEVPEIEIFELDAEEFLGYIEDKTKDVPSKIRRKYATKESKDTNRIFRNTQDALIQYKGIDAITNHLDAIDAAKNVLQNGTAKKRNGTSQVALNIISKNNNKIYVGENKEYIKLRRNTKRFNTDTNKVEDTTSALSLRSYNDKNTNLEVYQDIDGVETVIDSISLSDALDRITSISKTGESNVNNGFGLRVSANKYLENKYNNEATRESVEQEVSETYETKFSGITESYISFNDNNASAINNKQQEVQEDNTETLRDQESKTQIDEILNQNIDNNAKLELLSKLYAKTKSQLVKDSINNIIAGNNNDADTNETFNPDEEADLSLQDIDKIPTSSPLIQREYMALLKRLVPDISSEEVIALSRTMMMEEHGSNILGKYKKGLIYLLKGDNNTVDAEIVRHEAFHKIFKQYLTSEQQMMLLSNMKRTSEARKYAEQLDVNVSDLTAMQLEELLARMFQKYNLNQYRTTSSNKSINKIIQFFSKLSNIVKGLVRYFERDNSIKNIQKIFNNIDGGKYQTRLRENSEINSNVDLTRIRTYFPTGSYVQSLEMYFKAKSYVKDKINELLDNKEDVTIKNERIVNLPRTLTEASAEVLANIVPNLIIKLNEEGTIKDVLKAISAQNADVRKQYAATIQNEETKIMYYLGWMVKTDKSSSYKVFNDVIKDIFKEYKKQNVDEMITEVLVNINRESTDYDSDEVAGIVEEVAQNIYTDNELRLSEELRQFFSLIKKDTGYVSGKYAYKVLLEIMQRIDLNEMSLAKDYLEKEKGSNVFNDKKNIIESILNIITEATTESYRSKKINTLFIDGISFRNGKAIIGKKTIDNTAGTKRFYEDIFSAIVDNKEIYTKLTKSLKLDPSNDNRVSVYDYIKKLERKHKSLDLLGKIHHEIGSQTLSNPMEFTYETVVKQEKKDGSEDKATTYKLKTRTVNKVPEGIAIAEQRGIEQALIRFIDNNKEDKDAIDKAIKLCNTSYIKVEGSKMSKKNNKSSGINTTELLYDSMNNLFKLLNLDYDAKQYGMNKMFNIADYFHSIFVDVQKINKDTDSDMLIDNAQGFISELTTEIVSINDNDVANNYVDARGHKRYLYIISSYIDDVLGKIMREHPNSIVNQNNYIGRNSIFKNIKIHKKINFDGLSKKNSSLGSRTVRQLSAGEYNMVKFLHGFVDAITTRSYPSYFQFTTTQSNRNQMTGVDIRVHERTSLIDAIKKAAKMEEEAIKTLTKQQISGWSNKTTFMNIDPETKLSQITSYAQNSFIDAIVNMSQVANINLLYETVSKAYDRLITESRKEDGTIEYKSDYFTNEELKSILDSFENEIKDKVIDIKSLNNNKYKENIIRTYEKLYVLYHQFYRNNYVNSFHLDAVVFNVRNISSNAENFIKRMQGIGSPGRGLLTSKNLDSGFAPVYSPYVVFDDISRRKSAMFDVKGIYEKVLGEKYDITDGISYITPEALDDIHKGTRDYEIGNIIKNIVFYTDEEGITRYIKTSSVVLSDKLCNTFPELDNIRKQMRESGAKHYIAASAFKVGKPAKSIKFGAPITKDNVFLLDNRYYRIQFNPVTDKELVSNPSQFNYFINVNGLNEEEAFTLYRIDQQLHKYNWYMFNDKYKLVSKDEEGNNVVDMSVLRREVLKLLMNSDERVYDMLSYGMDINYPAIVSRIIPMVTSKISKNTVKIKSKGQKLILQPASGTAFFELNGSLTTFDKLSEERINDGPSLKDRAKEFYSLNFDLREALMTAHDILTDSNKEKLEELKEAIADEFKLTTTEEQDNRMIFMREVDNLMNYKQSIYLIPRRLKMRDAQGYTEVAAPAWWLKKEGINVGDVVVDKYMKNKLDELYRTSMAIRVPSTGIHSGIAMRIVASIDMDTNSVIAPEEIVLLHGSDYDVDSLFALRRDPLEKDITITKEDGTKETFTKGTLLGYNSDGKWDTTLENDIMKLSNTPDNMYAKYILLQNKKADYYIRVITSSKNREDMNTPIDFNPIKLDAFDINITSVKGDVEEYLNGWIDNMKYIARKALEQVYDIESIRGKNVFDTEEFKKGNIVFKNEYQDLKDAILNSRLGVISKMKVITGKQSVRREKDLGRLEDQLVSHLDNHQGTMGVGIQANIMKVFAYLLYGSEFKIVSDKETVVFFGNEMSYKNIISLEYKSPNNPDKGVHVRYRDIFGNIKQIKGDIIRSNVNSLTKSGREVAHIVDDILYDGITTTTRGVNKQSTFALGDTLINGYIDNVKEQITWIINAGPATINNIGYMLGLGFDLDFITYMMNQPAIREISTSKSNLNDKINDLIKYIRTKLNSSVTEIENKDGEKEEIDSVDGEKLETEKTQGTLDEPKKVLATDRLINVLSKHYGKYVTGNSDMSKDDLITQLLILKMFKSFNSRSNSITNINSVLSTLKDLPAYKEDAEYILDNIRNLKKDGFYFHSPNFFSIPNIASGIENLEMMNDILDKAFIIYNEDITSMLDKAIKDTGIKMENTYSFNTKIKSRKLLRAEFQAFVMTSFIEQLINDGTIPNTKYIAVSRKGKLLTKEEAQGKDDVRYINKYEAFRQDFILDLINLQAKYPDNKFLKFFSHRKSWTGLYTFKFHGGTNLDDNAKLELMKGYLDMPDNIREKFLINSVLLDKGTIGFRGYSTAIPPDNSPGAKDGLATINEVYMPKIRSLMSSIKLDNIYSLFVVQLLKNNADNVNTSFESYDKGRKTRHVLNEDEKKIFFTMYDNDETIEKIEMQNSYVILKDAKNTKEYTIDNDIIYKKVTNYKNYVVYKPIDVITWYNVYEYNSRYENEKYDDVKNGKIVTTKTYNDIVNSILLGKDYIEEFKRTTTSFIEEYENVETSLINTTNGERFPVLSSKEIIDQEEAGESKSGLPKTKYNIRMIYKALDKTKTGTISAVHTIRELWNANTKFDYATREDFLEALHDEANKLNKDIHDVDTLQKYLKENGISAESQIILDKALQHNKEKIVFLGSTNKETPWQMQSGSAFFDYDQMLSSMKPDDFQITVDMLKENGIDIAKEKRIIVIDLKQIVSDVYRTNVSTAEILSYVVSHEINHALFNYVPKNMEKEMKDIFKAFLDYEKNNPYADEYRGGGSEYMKRETEFFADAVSNPQFMKYLDNIKYDRKFSIGQKIWRWILKRLGFVISGSKFTAKERLMMLYNKNISVTNINKGMHFNSEGISGAASNKVDTSIRRDLTTNDESIFYTNGIKKYLRVNTLLDMLRPSYDPNIDNDIERSIAKKVWQERGLLMADTLERKNIKGEVIERISFDDYIERLRKKRQMARYRGKGTHSLFEYLRTGLLEHEQEYKEYFKLAEVTQDDIEKLIELYKNEYDSVLGAKDIVIPESTWSLELDDFNTIDKDGNDITMNGIAGTIDSLVDHGDNTFTIDDFKARLSSSIMDKVFKYASKAGVVGFEYSQENRSKMQLTEYALMIKANIQEAKFEGMNMVVYGDSEMRRVSAMYELEKTLKIFEQYFKEEHPNWYNNNKALFNYKEYYADNSFLKAKEKRLADEGINEADIRKRMIADELALLQRLTDTKVKHGASNMSDDDKKSYINVLDRLGELFGEKGILKSIPKGMSILSALFDPINEKSHPLLKLVGKLFFNANDKMREEEIRVWDEDDMAIDFLYKKDKYKYSIGAGYKDSYAFLWKDHTDDEATSLEGEYIRTYKDDDWNTLDTEEKDYADFYRWTIRYQLFRTMNPAEGIKFIERELAERDKNIDFSDNKKAYLQNQLKELKNTVQWNKFPGANKSSFKYFEGWTPRLNKQAEEEESFGKMMKRNIKNNFTITEDEQAYLLKNKDNPRIVGLPVRFFGNNESGKKQKEEYTYNGQMILRQFTSNMIRKRYYDDVYNVAEVVKAFMKEQNEALNSKINDNNIKFLTNWIAAVITQQKIDNFNGRTVNGISIDRALRGMRTYWGVTSMAFNVTSGIRTGLSQLGFIHNNAIAGSITKALAKTMGVSPESIQLTGREALKSIVSIFDYAKDNITGNLKNNKNWNMNRKLGNLVESYDYNTFNKNRLKTAKGYMLPKQIDSDLAYFLYKNGDVVAYTNAMENALRTMKVKQKDGTIKSMYDLYDNNFNYIGESRGINEITGEEIKGLTGEEIIMLKNITRSVLGNLREEERTGAEAETWGILYMQFKRYLYPMVRNAWKSKGQHMALGRFIESVDENGNVKMIDGKPVMKWMEEVDEGYIRSLGRSFMILYYLVRDKENGKKEWNALSDRQKYNVVLALVKISNYALLTLMISAIFGDNDDDDENRIKRNAVMLKKELVSDWVVFDPTSFGKSVLSVPSITKTFEFAGSLKDMFESVLTDDRVESGEYKGWYKGQRKTMRSILGVSTIIDFYDMSNDWGELEEEIKKAKSESIRK